MDIQIHMIELLNEAFKLEVMQREILAKQVDELNEKLNSFLESYSSLADIVQDHDESIVSIAETVNKMNGYN